MPVSWIKKLIKPNRSADAAHAYDLWAGKYDQQAGNLMLDMDEDVFRKLLNDTLITDRVVVDVGCGTGRHWQKIMDQQPARLIGYDVSKKMLHKLREKFFTAVTYVSVNDMMPELKSKSVDLLISTLTIAHIEKFEKAFTEWDRVLKMNGEMILTDYHPEALAKGAKRTFLHQGRIISIKNHIHSTNKIRLLAEQLGYSECRFIEKNIDEEVRPYYEKQHALHLYEQFKHTPIIYGLHLKKTNDLT
jgi:ubiquinone/menaquinone biosynthesis C-methylase UbiE